MVVPPGCSTCRGTWDLVQNLQHHQEHSNHSVHFWSELEDQSTKAKVYKCVWLHTYMSMSFRYVRWELSKKLLLRLYTVPLGNQLSVNIMWNDFQGIHSRKESDSEIYLMSNTQILINTQYSRTIQPEGLRQLDLLLGVEMLCYWAFSNSCVLLIKWILLSVSTQHRRSTRSGWFGHGQTNVILITDFLEFISTHFK